MIIVSFSEIADVPPQNVHKEVLSTILHDAEELIDIVDYDALTETLGEWEADLFMNSVNPDDDWYTRALVCICLRGLRGECRPNILNIS
jgi:hypothetical protein